MLSTRSDASKGAFSERMAELAPTLNRQTEQGEFYLPVSHVQILEKVEHLSRYSNFIQIVIGVAGSGKSTLLKQFYPADDDSGVQACFIAAENVSNISVLLDMLTEQLKIDLPVTADDEDKLQAIYEYADLLQDISRLFLIVVDDAEKLGDDCLDLLVNLLPSIQNPDARPHVVLFSLPVLAERMNASARFKRTVDASCHFVELKPFELEEVQGFIQHNFAAEAELFDPKLISRLHQESFGLPGRIPKVLEKLLSVGGDRPMEGPSNAISWLRFPRLHLMLAVVVTAIAVATLIGFPDTADEIARDRIRVDLPVPAQADREQVVLAQTDPALSLEQRLKEADARLQAEVKAGLNAEAMQLKIESQVSDKVRSASPKVEPAGEVETTSLLTVAPVAPVIESSSAAVNSKTDAAAPKKLILKIPEVKAAKRAEAVVTEANPGATVKVAPKAQAKRSSPYLREDELLSWNPKGYTLQMLGARKELSVAQFIKAQAKKDDFYYFSTMYKGKPWYVVVFGNYSNRDKAILAVANLPANLRRKKPWARSIQGVQEDIKRK
ncbi:MAG: AAA family ATPase [Motiliproteus sp.]